jgi:hypothetical protein
LFPLFSTGVIDKFAAGVVDNVSKFATVNGDTGDKLATGINNTSGTGGKICCQCG